MTTKGLNPKNYNDPNFIKKLVGGVKKATPPRLEISSERGPKPLPRKNPKGNPTGIRTGPSSIKGRTGPAQGLKKPGNIPAPHPKPHPPIEPFKHFSKKKPTPVSGLE